jgi:hypothetical protein
VHREGLDEQGGMGRSGAARRGSTADAAANSGHDEQGEASSARGKGGCGRGGRAWSARELVPWGTISI